MKARYEVDAQAIAGPNTRFWQACGHDYLFKLANEPSGQELLDRFELHGSMRYLRTHYTFSNRTGQDVIAGGPIGGNVVFIDDDGAVSYDFTIVNRTFGEYVRHGLKPIVEFDFFPDGMTKDSEDSVNDEGFGFHIGEPKEWGQWERLLRTFVQNLIDTFGVEEMRSWYFEVWNEPDGWPVEQLPVFFRLYDVFAHVVKSFDRGFRVGGPACFHSYFLRDFLEHVVHGTNHVTGATGSPIDFISYHVYGLSGFWLKEPPYIHPAVNQFSLEVLWLQRLLNGYQKELGDVEFHLNEWGLCSNFLRTVKEHPDLAYRNSEASPLFLMKLVDCLYAIGDARDFETAMLLYWGFCGEADQASAFLGQRELTTVANIPKPMLTGFELLAKLGENRLSVAGPQPGGRTGLLPARTDDTIQLLLYNYSEADTELTVEDEIEVALSNLSGRTFVFEGYHLDRSHNNTYRAWEGQGAPDRLDQSQIDDLKQVSELKPTTGGTVDIVDGRVETSFRLERHSALLIVGRLES